MATKLKGKEHINCSNINKLDYIWQGTLIETKNFHSSLNAHDKETI